MADKDLYLSESPNVDKGFVEQDGKLRKTVLTAIPSGDLQLSDSANVSTGYVTDDQGKKHRVNLVAEVEGTLELPDESSSDTGYVVDGDGKKHKVQLTATLYGGGSAPVIDELNVTPTTSAQTITAPEGTDGYSPVNVSAVTSAIDANIVAGNIKKDVEILGVRGSYEGVAPTGTKSITTNGIHDVAGYASADVQVPTTAPAHYVEKTVDANGMLINGTNIINLSGVTDVGDSVLSYAYYNAPLPVNTSADLSSLTKVTGQNACYYMFKGCTSLTSVDLSGLTTISGVSGCSSMFDGCSKLTSVDLSGLTTLSGNSACQQMFTSSKLTSVDLSSLTTISGSYACRQMFYGCTSLATVYIGGTTAINFGTNTNQFYNMFLGCSQNIDVYAPAANQTQIEAFSGYPKFGATGNVVWHWRS